MWIFLSDFIKLQHLFEEKKHSDWTKYEFAGKMDGDTDVACSENL